MQQTSVHFKDKENEETTKDTAADAAAANELTTSIDYTHIYVDGIRYYTFTLPAILNGGKWCLIVNAYISIVLCTACTKYIINHKRNVNTQNILIN